MLSKKAQYAFHALTYLADHAAETAPIAISEIAEQKHLPLKFLEVIFAELKHAGVLVSKKGKTGGYYLARPAHEIPLAEIIRRIDGPIALLPCVSLNFYQPCENCDEHDCGLNHVMAEVRDATLQVLEGKTLQDIRRRKPA